MFSFYDVKRMMRIAVVLFVLAVGALYMWRMEKPSDSQFVWQAQALEVNDVPVFSKAFVSDHDSENREQVASVHAASITLIGDDFLDAVWFGGSREGARDVGIFYNRYDLKNQAWGEPRLILSREKAEELSGIFIKKLGNPVIYRSDLGVTHLFVVTASLGGWATSRILHFQLDEDNQVKFLQTLMLSPFANMSYLVRNAPITLQDGSFYLPIYHELANKFNVLLHFDVQGNLISRLRMDKDNGYLQPSLAAISNTECVLVSRNQRRNADNPDNLLSVQYCADAGRTWGERQLTNIHNYDNSLNVVQLFDNILLIHNQSKDNLERYYLSVSKLNGDKVRVIARLDQADDGLEVSYPSTLVIGDQVHVVYTYQRRFIRHLVFNLAWLKAHGL